MPWSYDLRHQLLTSFPFPKGVHPIPDDRFLEPRWKLSPYSCAANKIQDQEPAIADTFSSLEPSSNTPKARITIEAKQESKSTVTNGFANSDHPLASLKTQDLSLITPQSLKVTLEANQRLTPVEHWQDVRHLVLASESTIDYGPGDVLTIYPNNHADDVGQLLKRMNWVALADLPIHFIQTKASEECNFKPSLPSTLHSSSTTLRELLTSRLDITAIPRRSFFSFVAHFTGDQFQRDRLLEFTKPEYIDELYDYTTRPRRSILEVLQEFESVEVPWQWAASMLPDLRGRQFSIASGGILKQIGGVGTRFELLAAIVKYKTVIKKMREGVCTRYLAALPVGSELDVTLQKGSLTIKQDECRRPIVMIGPGTGVAPMRSLIWERKLWSCNVKETTSVEGSDPIGLSLLLFGCRNEGADYFYREEWEDLKTDMPFEVHAAFSRDQSQKIYVQDLIQRQSQIVYRVLHDENGLIYVCGSSGKMPQAVRSALADVFMKHGKLDQVSASNYLEGMEKDGRYKQETWWHFGIPSLYIFIYSCVSAT